MLARMRLFESGGLVYVYDRVRDKILSINRMSVRSGRYGYSVSNEMLRIEGVPTSTTPFSFRQDSTIVGISVRSAGDTGWTIKIFKNNESTPIYSEFIGFPGFLDSNLNIDLNAGDTIRFFAEGFNVKMPVVEIEYAYRMEV